MSEQGEGKVTVSLQEAVKFIKSRQDHVPAHVKAISAQNRALREARRTQPTSNEASKSRRS